MTDPEDGHPLCCSIRTTNPPACSCWHEEIRMAPRRRPTPKPNANANANARVEAVELPCDRDLNEAS